MEFSKKQIALLYVHKNKVTIFGAGSESSFEFVFPKTTVNNLEVIDKSAFEQSITTCITTNEIKLQNMYVVLDKEVIFEKELEDIPLSLQSVEAEKFLEMVPFHNIVTKTYNFSNKTIIVAANKNFCDEIVSAFSENQCVVVGIIPLSIFEEKLPQLREGFDGKLALKKIEALKQYFLPLGIDSQDKLLTYEVPSLKNIQFVVLISIFSLLLFILGIQVYTQILNATPKVQPIKINTIRKDTPSAISPSVHQSVKEAPSGIPAKN